MATMIAFGGGERELQFPLREMRKLEQLDPRCTLQGLPRMLLEGSLEALALAIWVGLKNEDPKIELRKVRDQLDDYCDMDGADLGQLFRDVAEAITESNWFKQVAGVRPTT